MARAARMPMIATTIISSTRVNPRLPRIFCNFRIIMLGSFVWVAPFSRCDGPPDPSLRTGSPRMVFSSLRLVVDVNRVGEIRAHDDGVGPRARAIGHRPSDVPVGG